MVASGSVRQAFLDLPVFLASRSCLSSSASGSASPFARDRFDMPNGEALPGDVRSACRSRKHNRSARGAKGSKHIESTAVEFAMSKHDPVPFQAEARDAGFLGFGFYLRSGFSNCLDAAGRNRCAATAARRPLPPHGARRCAPDPSGQARVRT